ncbi:MAG TPA: acetyl-CoA hydrolase/transferase C-terminal domain-containing protein [Steroidobacteraceae bacterium]|nr:acetyl-CoA hydrolase/transferase C-terminal domain-containing protein [Steroidobacteraceae bacterium]
MPQMFDDVGEIVEEALRRVGKRVVLALPLGIGKPNLIANEFFRRARADSSMDLTIFTALSLRKPTGQSALEKAFIDPLAARVFGNYPDLDYLAAVRRDEVPANVRVIEFFFEPGSLLNSAHAQSHYLCANYTHVARELLARGVNVVAHVVAKRVVAGVTEISLGSNPDITVDLMPEVARMRAAGSPVVLLGQVHREMPFMLGAATSSADNFDLLLDHSRYDYDLFAPPNPSLSTVDHAIGLHASSLVRDGGTLQIGIGELGDSIVYSLLLRHQQNEAWRRALVDAGTEHGAALIDSVGGRAPFATGLFGATEMFVDQMLDLYRAGVLRRRVYDYLPLQRALAANGSGTRVDEALLEALLAAGAGPVLGAGDVASLRSAGVLRSETRFENGSIISPEGVRIEADLGNARVRAALARDCLGLNLQGGTVMHAGFLLGPRSFYAALNALPETERRLFDMRGVGYINQLYGDDLPLRVAQRSHARFVNTTMMLTTLGAAISDALADGRVVSGVGGQYNFVTMAHALPGARSVLCVRSTRRKDGKHSSNIVTSFGHTTIPRHLRDIAVTEYGIADLRGRTDAECVAAMINIADSRFQESLLAEAKRAHKIDAGYRVPEQHRHNTPERLEEAFAAQRHVGLFSEYPFGTDLTREEIELARALRWLKENTATTRDRVLTIAQALFARPRDRERACLARLQLDAPRGLEARLNAKLVRLGLRVTADTRQAVISRTAAKDP